MRATVRPAAPETLQSKQPPCEPHTSSSRVDDLVTAEVTTE
jgi:hypothetical protein